MAFTMQGNVLAYEDCANSLLPAVLRSKRGIPILLAIVHCAVGRRAGLPIEPVGLPAHFVTKMGAEGSPDERFVDVFRGGKLLCR